MDIERARNLIIETKARAVEWVTTFGKPNYPENLSLALVLAAELEQAVAEQSVQE